MSAQAMTVLVAHADVAPLLPLPLLGLLAAAVPLAAGKLGERARARAAAARPATAEPAARVMVGAVVAVSAAAAVAGFPPARVLAVLWLSLTAASLALGPVWAAANPLRGLTAPAHRWLSAGEVADRAAPARLARTSGLVALLAVGWLQVAPLRAGVVVAGLLAYLAAHLLGGVYQGPPWFEGADPVQRYGRLAALARSARAPAQAATRGFVAALVAVPVHARLVDTELWGQLTTGVQGGLVLVAHALALVTTTLLVAALLGLTPGGQWGVLATAAVAFFAAHQTALLVAPGAAVTAATDAGQAALAASTALPLLVLLAGHAHALYRLHRDTRALPGDQAGAVRAPVQVMVTAMAVVGAVLMARPL